MNSFMVSESIGNAKMNMLNSLRPKTELNRQTLSNLEQSLSKSPARVEYISYYQYSGKHFLCIYDSRGLEKRKIIQTSSYNREDKQKFKYEHVMKRDGGMLDVVQYSHCTELNSQPQEALWMKLCKGELQLFDLSLDNIVSMAPKLEELDITAFSVLGNANKLLMVWAIRGFSLPVNILITAFLAADRKIQIICATLLTDTQKQTIATSVLTNTTDAAVDLSVKQQALFSLYHIFQPSILSDELLDDIESSDYLTVLFYIRVGKKAARNLAITLYQKIKAGLFANAEGTYSYQYGLPSVPSLINHFSLAELYDVLEYSALNSHYQVFDLTLNIINPDSLFNGHFSAKRANKDFRPWDFKLFLEHGLDAKALASCLSTKDIAHVLLGFDGDAEQALLTNYKRDGAEALLHLKDVFTDPYTQLLDKEAFIEHLSFLPVSYSGFRVGLPDLLRIDKAQYRNTYFYYKKRGVGLKDDVDEQFRIKNFVFIAKLLSDKTLRLQNEEFLDTINLCENLDFHETLPHTKTDEVILLEDSKINIPMWLKDQINRDTVELNDLCLFKNVLELRLRLKAILDKSAGVVMPNKLDSNSIYIHFTPNPTLLKNYPKGEQDALNLGFIAKFSECNDEIQTKIVCQHRELLSFENRRLDQVRIMLTKMMYKSVYGMQAG